MFICRDIKLISAMMEGWNWSKAELNEVNNGIMEKKRLDFCLYLIFSNFQIFHYYIDSNKIN